VAAAGLHFRIIPAGFIPFRDKSLTGFNAPLEFLTGFTSKYIVFVGQAFRPAYCKAPAAGPCPTKCKLFCALDNNYGKIIKADNNGQ
jgi:hypothetical protein